MIRRPPRSTQSRSSAASDVYKRQELYYAGFSYGTFLGATYADLYPEKVGRMVLDGALDPSMSNDDLIVGQAIGFENALRAYVAYCQAASGCPLTGDVDAGMAQIAEIVARAEADPIPTGAGAGRDR